MRHLSVEVRLERSTHRDPNSGCWLWCGRSDGSTNRNGYPSFVNNGKKYRVSRWILEQKIGPIPAGIVARHICDTPECVNPAHIVSGTQKENIADMYKRGRNNPQRGSNHHQSKLNEIQVSQIKKLIAEGISQRKIANIFDVKRGCIQSIKEGGWSHVR